MTTRQEWAVGFVTYAGWAVSVEKTDALVAQASREDAGALNNPLATTEPGPGTTDYNSAGVKNYPTLEEGYGATLATFRNGHYPTLLAVLSDPAGGSAVTYCSSADLNTWGTGNCMPQLSEIRSGDPQGYLTTEIAGGGPTPSPVPLPTPPPGDDMDNLTFIRWVYWAFLFRPVDAGGFSTWNAYLAGGGSREQMIAVVQESQEGVAAAAALRRTLSLG